MTIIIVLFALLAVFAVSSVWSNSYRDVIYLIGLAGMSALIAASICFAQDRGNSVILVIFQIVVLGIISRATIFYSTPGLVGIDPWFHAAVSELTIATGRIAPQSYAEWYSSFPGFQLLVSEVVLISGVSVKDAMFLGASIFEIFSAIPVFLLGRHYFNQRVGLLAAYLTTVATYSIRWGSYVIPTTIGLAYLPYFLYIVVCFNKSPVRSSIIFYIFSAAIIVTHTLSSFVILCVVGLFYFSTWATKRFDVQIVREREFSFFNFFIYGISLLTYWLYNANQFIEGFVVPALGSFLRLSNYQLPQSTVTSAIYQPSFLVFFSFSIVGSLLILRKEFRKRGSLTYLFATWGLTLLTFIMLAVAADAVLPYRWLSFVMVLMALPVALGIGLLCENISKRIHVRVLTIVVIVMVISLLMVTDQQANAAGSFGAPNYTLKISELQSLDFFSKVSNGTVSSDLLMTRALKYDYGYADVFDASEAFADGRVGEIPPGIIIVPSHPYGVAETSTSSELINMSSLDSLMFDRIYDSQTITAYSAPNSSSR